MRGEKSTAAVPIGLCMVMALVELWSLSVLFPDKVTIQNQKTLVWASVIITVSSLVYQLITLGIAIIVAMVGNETGTLILSGVLILMQVFFYSIALWIATLILPGLIISGFWWYVLIGLIMTMLNITIRSND